MCPTSQGIQYEEPTPDREQIMFSLDANGEKDEYISRGQRSGPGDWYFTCKILKQAHMEDNRQTILKPR